MLNEFNDQEVGTYYTGNSLIKTVKDVLSFKRFVGISKGMVILYFC